MRQMAALSNQRCSAVVHESWAHNRTMKIGAIKSKARDI
jgi:hypothetical protein